MSIRFVCNCMLFLARSGELRNERERMRERESETGRDKKERDRDRDRDRQTLSHTHTYKERETERDRDRETETETKTERDRETDREAHTAPFTQHKHKHSVSYIRRMEPFVHVPHQGALRDFAEKMENKAAEDSNGNVAKKKQDMSAKEYLAKVRVFFFPFFFFFK